MNLHIMSDVKQHLCQSYDDKSNQCGDHSVNFPSITTFSREASILIKVEQSQSSSSTKKM